MEVFEIDVPEIPLINIASRSKVETGDDVMIVGFVIQGNGARTVLVTARGPSLAVPPFNVPGTLADPYLRKPRGAAIRPVLDRARPARLQVGAKVQR